MEKYYLKKKSTNILAKIHEELMDADLIEEKWQGFGKSYRTYIKYYETTELERTIVSKDYDENESKEIIKLFHCSEFSDFDIQDAKELIQEELGEFPYINVSKILKNLDFDFYSEKDMKMIKYALAYMDYHFDCSDEEDYEWIIQCIDLDIIDKAMIIATNDNSGRSKAAVLGEHIYELAGKKFNEE